MFCHSERSRGRNTADIVGETRLSISHFFDGRIVRDIFRRGRWTVSLDMTKTISRTSSLKKLFFSVITMFVGGQADAQFSPGILANDSYWSDGKAEFNFYDAQLMRNGQPRHCELLHIFVREKIDPKTSARIDDPKRTDAVNAIRMNQIWTAPIGMFVEQGSIAAHWRNDSAALMRLMFIGTDSFGNIAKRIEVSSAALNFTSDTYRDGASAVAISPPGNGIFYDELPLRVRTIDWSKPPKEFEVQLAPTLVNPGTDKVEFKPAKVSWKPVDKSIEVNVQHANGADRFLLDRDFPFLLRQWEMADGSKLKMKCGLKADYWNYGKEGDRERALKNPMLGHPD